MAALAGPKGLAYARGGRLYVADTENPALGRPRGIHVFDVKGTSPLGAATDWVQVACPSCGGG